MPAHPLRAQAVARSPAATQNRRERLSIGRDEDNAVTANVPGMTTNAPE
jgi:hypothetical protein